MNWKDLLEEQESDLDYYLLTDDDIDHMRKKNALEKARSQLKKAEHVTTPLSIKRKLKGKRKG